MSNTCFLSHFLLLCLLFARAAGLASVQLVLPPAVAAGSSATLLCLYDLQRAPLYSVKWYRGSFEFYRFVPADRPPKRAFPFPGLVVDLRRSGDRQVTLRAVPLHLAGVFTCEVSADAPSFSTDTARGELAVVDVDHLSPEIAVEKRLTSHGYIFAANCTTVSPEPEVTLTFFVNDVVVASERVVSGATLQVDVAWPGLQERLWLRCEAVTRGWLRAASRSVTVCRRQRSGTSVQRLSAGTYFFLVWQCYKLMQ
ncbi:uncharacterized protein LOC134533200 [Bacillus rossius redtenbacheri]|uniref:uncharacterized protein LOC134533200 n=1 Tax=Bacillus rossius redtenbacheri TaxID=93214 RepID=UPI002FDD13CB